MSDDREVLVREFPVSLAEGDGRTLEARIVPYNEPARVADPPDYTPYEEMFLPGAFERQTGAANRVEVYLNFEHEQGLRGIVGHGVKLEDRGDALYGTFRLHDNPDGDKARQMVNEGILTGLSVEFAPIKSERGEGMVKRVRAHLDKVSLCRLGLSAYKSAQVLALREAPEPEPEPDESAPPPPEPERNSAVDEILSRIGYEPILRRAIVRTPWNGSAARFEDDEWKRSCILDRGDGFDTPKTRFGFPVLEPNGDLNVNGMHAAAARLNQANATPNQKAAAARKLIRYYNQAGEEPPPALRAMATR